MEIKDYTVDNNKKQVLIDFENWQVCKLAGGVDACFGVHKYCSGAMNNEEPGVFNWGWMADDMLIGCIERCFRCREVVPPEVVAIIVMLHDNTENQR